MLELRRAPAWCSTRPVHRPKMQAAECSRGDACVSRPLSYTSDCAVRQDAREYITRFMEYEAACRAPIRTLSEVSSSATSVWVKVSAQSELMGPSSAGFALAPCILLRSCGVAIDVLIPPSTPSPRLSWSNVSVMDLRRLLARWSNSPLHRPKMQVAACGRGGATHGLFLTSRHRAAPAVSCHSTRLSRCKTAFTAPARIVVEL